MFVERNDVESRGGSLLHRVHESVERTISLRGNFIRRSLVDHIGVAQNAFLGIRASRTFQVRLHEFRDFKRRGQANPTLRENVVNLVGSQFSLRFVRRLLYDRADVFCYSYKLNSVC